MDKNQKKIGELLIEAGKITKQDIEEAMSLKNENEKLGDFLIRLGKITKQDMDDVLKSQKQLDLTGVKKKTQRLGDILIKSGKVTKEQIDNALEIKKSSKDKLGEILVNEGIISQEEMNDIVEKQTGIKTIDLDKYIYEGECYKYIPKNLAKKYTLLPLEKEDNYIRVAMVDPFDIYAVDNISLYTGLRVIPVFSARDKIERKIEELYTNGNDDVAEIKIKDKDNKKMVNVDLSYDINNVKGIEVFGSTNIVKDINDKPSSQNKPNENKSDENLYGIFGYKESSKEDQGINERQEDIFGKKKKKMKLGEILIKDGKITEQQVQEALEIQKKSKQKIGEILVEKGFISQQEIDDAVFRQTGIKTINLDKFLYTGNAHRLIPERLARKYRVIPLKKEQMKITVAMVDPFDIFAIDDISLYTGLEVIPVFASEGQIDRKLGELYRTDNIDVAVQEYKREKLEKDKKLEEDDDQEDNSEAIDNAPIVKLLNNIVNEAIRRRASDIHIEPSEKNIRVRYRVDGELRVAMNLEKDVHQSLIARIKILSKMNIAEKRIPQDGAFAIENKTGAYDLRTNILPTTYGEKACLRILDKNTVVYKKSELGFFEDEEEKFNRLLSIQNGLILVTGPTGSGKSTTMYTALSELNDEKKNIITAEDPIEIKISGINQVAINEKIGLTYAKVLRAFLRQDPDIIMVGEIRDTETAQIAVRSSITGHIVMSTLHTNSAAGTIMRLEDMGVEPYLIATSLKGVIAQRLVKKICPDCREEYHASEEEKLTLGKNKDEDLVLALGRGCTKCSNTGYFGRMAIAEIMEINKEQKNLIIDEATEDQINNAAIMGGMKTIEENMKRAVLEKHTTFQEYVKFIKFKEMEVK